MKRLISETTWSRLLADENGTRFYESKLELLGSEITLDEIEREWPNWDFDQQIDFAKALSGKSKLNFQDQLILLYMMRICSAPIASTIANSLTKLNDKESALKLLIQRMCSCEEPRANFYQALATFNDTRSVAALKAEYDRLNKIATDQTLNAADQYSILDYVACCGALGELTTDQRYMAVVEGYAKDSRQLVQTFAASILRDGMHPAKSKGGK